MLALPLGHHKNRSYAIDDFIKFGMLAADVGTRFAREFSAAGVSEVAKPDRRAVKMAHAKKMLVEWERKLGRAEKLAAKWRRRVRYYETRSRMASERLDTKELQSQDGTGASLMLAVGSGPARD